MTITVYSGTKKDDAFTIDVSSAPVNAIVKSSSGNDTIYLKGISSRADFKLIQGSEVEYEELTPTKNKNRDLVIETNIGGKKDYIILADYFTDNAGSSTKSSLKQILIDNPDPAAANPYIQFNIHDEIQQEFDAPTKGLVLNGTAFKDVIDVQNWDDGKGNGLTINTGLGNDEITGTVHNDIITGGAGENTIKLYGDATTYKHGADIVNLTKNETLTLDYGSANTSSLTYTRDKNDLVIGDADGAVTLKNYLTTGNAGATVYVKGADATTPVDVKTMEITNTVPINSKSFVGTALRDKIDASNNETGIVINAGAGSDDITGSLFNDTITGGTGSNTINIDTSSNYGNDTVILTKTESLNLNYGTGFDTDNLVYEKVGNDLRISTNVKYIMKATVNGEISGYTNDLYNYKNEKVTFNIDAYEKDPTGHPYVWKSEQPYITTNGTTNGGKNSYWYEDLKLNAAGTGLENEVVTWDYTDTAGNTTQKTIKTTNMRVYQVVGGKEIDVTDQIVELLKAGNDSAAILEELKSEQATDIGVGSVTLKNFFGNTGATVSINGDDIAGILAGTSATATVGIIGKGKLLGTDFNDEIFGSVTADTIITGKGDDEINAGGGNDTIQITGNGTKDLNFMTGGGKDTVIGFQNATTTNLNFENSTAYSITANGNDATVTAWHTDGTAKVVDNTVVIKDYLKYEGTTGKLNINVGDGTGSMVTSDAYTTMNTDNSLINKGASGADKAQTLKGTMLDETILGGNATDTIYTGAGDDDITPGRGNDRIYIDGAGDKTIHINSGDGNDTIYTAQNADSVDLKITGYDSISYDRKGNDLIITRVDNDGTPVYNKSLAAVYLTSDGQLTNNAKLGTKVNGTLYEVTYTDGIATTTSYAASGYVYDETSKTYKIQAGNLTFDLPSGYSVTDVTGAKWYLDGSNNVISNPIKDYVALTETTTISGYFAKDVNVDLSVNGSPVNSYSYTGSGKISFTDGKDYTIHGSNSNDTITLGAGHDTIYTGEGTDTVIAGAGINKINLDGKGVKTLKFVVGETDTNTVTMADGVTAKLVFQAKDAKGKLSDVEPLGYSRDGNNLVVSASGSETVTIKNFFTNTNQDVMINNVAITEKLISVNTTEVNTFASTDKFKYDVQIADGATYERDGADLIVKVSGSTVATFKGYWPESSIAAKINGDTIDATLKAADKISANFADLSTADVNGDYKYDIALGGDAEYTRSGDNLLVKVGENTVEFTGYWAGTTPASTIGGATIDATLRAADKISANFADLSTEDLSSGYKYDIILGDGAVYSRSNDDLSITLDNNTLTFADYFKSGTTTKLNGDSLEKTAKANVINVELGAGEYAATDYKEAYTIAKGVTGNVIIHNLDGNADSIKLNGVNFEDVQFIHRDGRLDMAYDSTLVLLAGYDSATNKLTTVETADGKYSFAVGTDSTEFTFSADDASAKYVVGALDGDSLNITGVGKKDLVYTRDAKGNLVITANGKEGFSVTLKDFFTPDVRQNAHLDTIKVGSDTVSILTDAVINVSADSYFLGYNVANNDNSAETGGYKEQINVTSGNLSNINIADDVLAAITGGDVTKTETDGTYTYSMKLGKSKTLDSIIVGQKGDDIINDSEGNDYLAGGEGDDTINSTKGEDALIGGAGRDTLDARTNTSDVEIYGGSGNDTIYSGFGNDFIWAGEGNDGIHLNGGSNRIILSDANFGTDTIYGATADDQLEFVLRASGKPVPGQSHNFSNLTFTRDGNDLKIADGENVVTVDGFFTAKSKVDKIIAVDDNDTAAVYSIKKDAVINVTGSVNYTDGYNYNVTGTAEDNTITTGSGNDHVTVNAGSNTVDTGAGKDEIRVYNHLDLRKEYRDENFESVKTAQVINGGDGDDTFLLQRGTYTANVTGGAGADVYDLTKCWFFDSKISAGKTYDSTGGYELEALDKAVIYDGARITIEDFKAEDTIYVSAWAKTNNFDKFGTVPFSSPDASFNVYYNVTLDGDTPVADFSKVTMSCDKMETFADNGNQFKTGIELIGEAGSNVLTMGNIKVSGTETVVTFDSDKLNKMTAEVGRWLKAAGYNSVQEALDAKEYGVFTAFQIANGGADKLILSSKDDTITFTSGTNSVVDGGEGSDTIIIDGGNNTVNGGAGDDTFIISNGADLKNGYRDASFESVKTTQVIDGGAGDDTFKLLGCTYDATLTGGDGADTYNLTSAWLYDAWLPKDYEYTVGGNTVIGKGAEYDGSSVTITDYSKNDTLIVSSYYANMLIAPGVEVNSSSDPNAQINMYFDVSKTTGADLSKITLSLDYMNTYNTVNADNEHKTFSDFKSGLTLQLAEDTVIGDVKFNAGDKVYEFDTNTIDKIVSNVQSWLNGTSYNSVAEALEAGQTDVLKCFNITGSADVDPTFASGLTSQCLSLIKEVPTV